MVATKRTQIRFDDDNQSEKLNFEGVEESREIQSYGASEFRYRFVPSQPFFLENIDKSSSQEEKSDDEQKQTKQRISEHQYFQKVEEKNFHRKRYMSQSSYFHIQGLNIEAQVRVADLFSRPTKRNLEYEKESSTNQKFLREIDKEDMKRDNIRDDTIVERRSRSGINLIGDCFIKQEYSICQNQQTLRYQKKIQGYEQQHQRTQIDAQQRQRDCKVQKIQIFYRRELKIPPKGRKISQETLFFKQYDYETHRLLPIERYIEQECSLDDEETQVLILCFVFEILCSGASGFIFLNTIRNESIEYIVSRVKQISDNLVPFLWESRPIEAHDLIQKGNAKSMTGDTYDACVEVMKVKGVDYLLKCGQTYHKMLDYWIQSEYLSREIWIQTLQFEEWIYSMLRLQSLGSDH